MVIGIIFLVLLAILCVLVLMTFLKIKREPQIDYAEMQDNLEESRRMTREVMDRLDNKLEIQTLKDRVNEVERVLEAIRVEKGEVPGYIVADSKGIMTAVSPSTCILFGYINIEELVGKSVDLLVPERFRTRHNEAMIRVVSAGIKGSFERIIPTMGLKKNGAEVPITIKLKAVQQSGEWMFGASIYQRAEAIL